MRFSTAAVISTDDSFLARMASASSVAGVKQRSVSFMTRPYRRHRLPASILVVHLSRADLAVGDVDRDCSGIARRAGRRSRRRPRSRTTTRSPRVSVVTIFEGSPPRVPSRAMDDACGAMAPSPPPGAPLRRDEMPLAAMGEGAPRRAGSRIRLTMPRPPRCVPAPPESRRSASAMHADRRIQLHRLGRQVHAVGGVGLDDVDAVRCARRRRCRPRPARR